MVTQEMMKAATQEWVREAARLQLQQQARARQGQDASPRRTRSGRRIRRLSLPSFLTCAFRSATTS